MTNLLVTWLISAVSLLIVAYVVPGIRVDGFLTAFLAALVIGLVNSTIGLVLKLLTFPFTFVTLGLSLLVINGVMLLVAARLVPGFTINGFWPALFGAILLSLVTGLLKGVLLTEE